jgi:hypothetical protein
MAAYVPQGWPESVRPPGSEDFEEPAVTWLLDVVPPDYRSYTVLSRHPAALAAMARSYRESPLSRRPAVWRLVQFLYRLAIWRTIVSS